MRAFLQKHVRNGGAIPKSKQLAEVYLSDVYLVERDRLKEVLRDKPVAIIFDEMSDSEGRYVFNVLIAPLELDSSGRILAYLGDTLFLEKTNHSTVARAVIKVVQDYDIDFDDVICFDTDAASYMKLAFNSILKALFPNSVHVTCLGHLNALIGESFTHPFKEVNEFQRKWSAVFYRAGARKFRYLKYLKENGVKQAMAPNPCATRWNSWFVCAKYHGLHFRLYKNFIASEYTYIKSPCASLKWLHTLFQDSVRQGSIYVQLKIIDDKCSPITHYIDVFQSRKPVTLKAFEALENLQIYFETNMALPLEAINHFFTECPEGDEMTFQKKRAIKEIFMEAMENASEKLLKYLDLGAGGQPAINFLKEVRVFDPNSAPRMSQNLADYDHIPGMSDIPRTEFVKYLTKLCPDAITAANTGPQRESVNVTVFWASVKDEVPHLYQLACRYMNAVTNSADAERSFSLYNLILTPRRRSLSTTTLQQLAFLYYNLRLMDVVAGEVDDVNPMEQLAEILAEMEVADLIPALPNLPELEEPAGPGADSDSDTEEPVPAANLPEPEGQAIIPMET